MLTIQYEKQCECKATASGPRLIQEQWSHENTVTIRTKRVALACDECDTPYRVTKKTFSGPMAGHPY